MCGIIGYIGKQRASTIILEGLKRLEYRGYDSAGLAILQQGRIDVAKKAGRVEVLVQESARHAFAGTTGIGHTRWATHGGVTDANAHPHVSSDGKLALIHNGVIENYSQMKSFLLKKGYTFKSETDTEVLCNLVAYHYAKESPGRERPQPLPGGGAQDPAARRGHLRNRRPLRRIFPREIVAARKASPLLLGVGDGEYILASDASAIISRTQNVVYLKDGELVHLSGGGFTISNLDQTDVSPVVDRITWSVKDAELNGHHAHFMEKEIFEQPQALENTMRGRFSEDGSTAQFGGLNLTPAEFRQIDRFMFCACGTAWHACLVAEHLIERFARLPVEVDYASEFRYRNSPLDPQHALFRHQPVRRDDRHPGRAARGQAQGLPGPRDQQRRRLDHRPRGRRRHLPARRAGDRRRLDEGLHLAAAGRRHDRPLRRADARHELRRRRPVRERPEGRPRPGPPRPQAGPAHPQDRQALRPVERLSLPRAGSPSSRSRSRARSS